MTSLEGLRILVTDDEPFVRQTIKTVIRSAGRIIAEQMDSAKKTMYLSNYFVIEEARNGAEALERTVLFRPDVVFCDIQMAPMGGLEFVQKLRGSTHRRLSELRVIMLTRNADKETVLASRRLNIGDFMVKPISPKQLSIRLTTVFSNWDRSSSWNVADD
jgi:two-component system, chemotaxis family, chemotaxis protein CheY